MSHNLIPEGQEECYEMLPSRHGRTGEPMSSVQLHGTQQDQSLFCWSAHLDALKKKTKKEEEEMGDEEEVTY